jgi:uncharacterized protein YraI
MFAHALKIAAVATAVTLATAGASMAAQYAWADQNAKVRAYHSTSSPTIDWVHEGQKVRVLGSWGSWYKIKVPGDTGWVKANVLDFNPGWNGGWNGGWSGGGHPGNPHVGGSFCVGGQHGSFCLGTGY